MSGTADTDPLYESRALPADRTGDIETLRADGFESRPSAANGVLYLRKHLSGPVNAGDGRWVA